MADLPGRDLDLASFRDELDRARSGSGGLILVSGEPGIGKTTVLDHAARIAAGSGFQVAWGTCWDGAGAPGLWPWQRILRSYDEVPGASTVMTGGGEQDPGLFTLFASVADVLRTASRTAPRLVVLDDLQWADADSLRLLRFLARDLHDVPVLLAGAFRDVNLAEGDQLRALAADTGTVRRHLPLGGLPPESVALVLTETVGSLPAPETVARVSALTAGNPFFVRELARLPALGLGGHGLPAVVDDAVATRVRELPEATRDALTVAAVVGRSFEEAVVLLASGYGPDDARRVFAPATAARLVEPADPGTHRFVHDLVREHLVGALSPGRLREAHRRVFDALVALPDVSLRTGRLAQQAVLGAPDVPHPTAVLWCDRAAHEAAAALRHGEAARHLGAAVELDRAAGAADLDRVLRLADALRRSGQLGRARTFYGSVVDTTTDPVLLGRAALGIHECGQFSQDSRLPIIRALDTARSGLAAASGDRALLARVMAALARETSDGQDRDPGRADRLATEAVHVARELGDPAVLAACLFARHDVIWGPGTAADRRDLGAELQQVATGHAPDLAFQGALCRYVALLELASPEAHGALVDLEELAAGTGQPLLQYLARTRRDAWDVMTGVSGIEQRVEESREMGATLEVPDAYGVFVTQLIVHDLGEDAPRRMADRRRVLGGRLMPPDFAIEERAFELLADGNTDGAAAVLRTAPSPHERSMFRWRALAAVAFDAELGWRCADTAVCRTVHDQLASYAGQLVVIGGGVAVVGPVDLYLGLAAGTMGDTRAAAEHLRRALGQARALGAVPWTERIERLLARAADGATCVFHREGAVWRLEYAGETAHLPDNKGLHDLVTLLARPGEPVSALVLAGGTAPAPQLGSDPVLDDAARAAYRRRLDELDVRLADATADGDEAGLQSAQDERDALIDELRSATGVGGRRRRLGDPGERARSTVTARIRDALGRIENVHPALGAHLRDSLRTGRSCVYEPRPPVVWSL